ncbi:MAG: DUF4430 domain-containing protein [Patescibacteria group bacterium]|nr:DUF4430 domain-containing protein [Patescibacteria group bacterium]
MKKEYTYYKIFYILIIILVLTGCATVKTDLVLQNSKELGVEDQAKEISVILKINNKQDERIFEHSIQEGKTAFDLMKELQNKDSIEFDYKESNVGVFVNSINNIENNVSDNIFWMFYVNDEMANVGIGAYDLQNGDVIEWKYIDTENIDF